MTYTRLLSIARQDKNEAEARKVVQQGLVAYPNNKTFLIEDLNLSMNSGDPTQTLDKISKAVAAEDATHYPVPLIELTPDQPNGGLLIRSLPAAAQR